MQKQKKIKHRVNKTILAKQADTQIVVKATIIRSDIRSDFFIPSIRSTKLLRDRYAYLTILLRTLLIVGLCGQASAFACDQPVGHFSSIEGDVSVQSDQQGGWLAAQMDTQLCEGDSIRAGKLSRAAISLITDAVLRLDEETTVTLVDVVPDPEERSFIELVAGAFQSLSRHPRRLTVNTPYLNGSIEGTEFVIRVNEDSADITVFEGTVIAANEHGEIPLNGGDSATAKEGEAPQHRVVVNPRNEVRWSIYYPPVMAAGDSSSPAVEEAAQLLSVGRFDQALTLLDQVIAGRTGAADAYALRAIVKITQNETEAARADADKAVDLDSSSSAAKIALSYVLQSQFDIKSARDLILEGSSQNPKDALIWARLAELELMLGNKKAAMEAADQAATIDPSLARTHMVKGFVALSNFDARGAQASFQQAINLDSSDPMSHLGLGLGLISDGHLAEGRKELEAAVALDSNNALLRAYLGKAYFEERRHPLDAQQYDIAKTLDPLDPTAYLYAGILNQTVNRPVEAIQDLEKSIALNDNRAVYRSRLLLDKDRAARGASLARVYSDLGFDQLGIEAATHSIALDPGNASAHRFLSDSYRNTTGRTEIARVSELLQSQLLQDVSLNPVQPSISSTNLNIVTAGGPANPGFNEFTQLFEKNTAQLNVSGFAGSNSTDGGEAVASGNYGPLSGSLGGFTYDTNGYRHNNDLQHDIYNAFGQWAISPKINVQAEYLHRKTKHGDLRQNFDLDDYDNTFRRKLDGDVWRAGARFSPTQNSDFLVSYIHSDFDASGRSVPIDIPGDFTLKEEASQNDKADQYEGQYLYRANQFNLVVGGSYAKPKIRGGFTATALISVPFPPFEFIDVQEFPTNSDTKDKRVYAYSNTKIGDSVLVTAGLSYHDYKEDLTSDGIKNDFDRWNPKLGIRWEMTDTLTARAAYFKTVKPVLVSNRTLEPTQVAGFNQFFDDPDATRSTRYAGGLDWRPGANLHIGGEITKRELDSPTIDFATLNTRYDNQDEWLNRLYLFWTPVKQWAFSAETNYDKFKNKENSSVAFNEAMPERVTTWTAPLKATYFNPTGWFVGTTVTYVDQKVERDAAAIFDDGTSQFALVDVAIGYRLRKRMGLVSLSAQNIFDKNFDYQDDSYRTFSDQPYVGPYQPDATLMGRISLNF